MSIKVRIPSLKHDITINRLTTDEMDDFPIIEFSAEFESEEEMAAVIADLEYISDYARIVSVLDLCVKDFTSKISDELVALEPRKAVDTLFEIYKYCVMVNPSIDIMTNEIQSERKPFPEDLEKAIDLLPDNISSAIKRHLYRDSFIDSIQLMDSEDDDPIAFEVSIDDVLSDIHELSFDIAKVRGLIPELESKIIGQRHAADHVYAIVRRLAVGFRDVNKPPAVLLFAGPTGVGKTLMAKVTTEYLFGSSNKFGRIDCATLSEKHDISKLIGAPPGYVGYPSDRGGDPKEQDPAVIFREVSKMGPNGGVLLLDEVEKAHPDIWDIFLTAFDEGYVKTSVGNVVDLRNVIIIMTTNLGSKEFDDMQRKNPIGFYGVHSNDICGEDDTETIKTIKKTATDALRDYMKPEMIGRITDVVPFMNLNKIELKAVAGLEWCKAKIYLVEKIKDVNLTEELKDHIASSASDKKLGARPVQRMIEQYAVDAVAEIYVEHPEIVMDATNIIIDIADNNGKCDMVSVLIGEDKYDYEIKQTLSEE